MKKQPLGRALNKSFSLADADHFINFLVLKGISKC